MINDANEDSKKITVHRDDLEILNKLTKSTDTSRSDLSTIFLTVYGAATSGLFLLSLNSESLDLIKSNRFNFLVVVFSSIFLVLLSLLEKTFDYFAHLEVGKMHVENIKNANTFSRSGKYSALSPNKLTEVVLGSVPKLQLAALAVNVVSMFSFIFFITE